MKQMPQRDPTTRLALEPRIVFDAAIAATVADAGLASEPAKAPLFEAPLIAPVTISGAEDITFSFTGLNTIELAWPPANVNDPGDKVTLTVDRGLISVDGVSWTTKIVMSGTQATLNSKLANLQYQTPADTFGPDSLHVVANAPSAGGVVDKFTVNIDVAPVPDIVADLLTTKQDTPITVDLIAGTNGASADNFEGADPYVSAFTQGAHGGVSILPDGTITYTPDPGFAGVDSFTYTVTSPTGFTETGLVTVEVKPASVPAPGSSPRVYPTVAADREAGLGPAQTEQLFVQHAVRNLPVTMEPNLYVQHSVRDEDVTVTPNLFVISAVRDAQTESSLRSAGVDLAAAPEADSPLFNDFGLSAPRTEFVSPLRQSGESAGRAEAGGQDRPVAATGDADATARSALPATAPTDTRAALPAAGAAGFSSQLRASREALRTARATDSTHRRN